MSQLLVKEVITFAGKAITTQSGLVCVNEVYSFGVIRSRASGDVITGITSKSVKSSQLEIHSSSKRRSSHSMTCQHIDMSSMIQLDTYFTPSGIMRP